ncbi:MAG: hypothetical protein CMC13_11905 [Flavobacteriaceae bacterium]|nr:hypothetical protein [Flavobacteriaceae bacterium]|tara:strand:- start:2402 stop:2767 length:366 start_codon:yes stop_codon:yes gene_type:complete
MKKILTLALLGLFFVGCSSDDDTNDGIDPNCVKPTQLGTSNVSTRSLVFSYSQPVAKSYVVEFGETGFSIGSGEQRASNSQTTAVDSIQPNTTYDLYVRAVCSETSVSSFAGPLTVTTASE